MIKTSSYYSKESKLLPNYIYNSTYVCTECNFQPVHFKESDNKCPVCKSSIDSTRAVGILTLDYIGEHFKKKKVSYQDLSSKDVSNMNSQIKKIAKNFNNYKKLTDEDCNEIIKYYINQYNLGYNETQKIKSIIVKDLFGERSYFYNFNIKDDINVILGPNGIGKTTIFKILRIIFPSDNNVDDILEDNRDYPPDDQTKRVDDYYRRLAKYNYGLDFLFKTPFSLFKVIFTYGAYVNITKKIDDENVEIIFTYGHSDEQGGFDGVSPEIVINSNDTDNYIKMENHYENVNMLFNRISDTNKFLYIKTNRMNDMDMIKQQIGDYIEIYCKQSLDDAEISLDDSINISEKLTVAYKDMPLRVRAEFYKRFEELTRPDINLNFINKYKNYFNTLMHLFYSAMDNNGNVKLDKKYKKNYEKLIDFDFNSQLHLLWDYDLNESYDDYIDSIIYTEFSDNDVEEYSRFEKFNQHVCEGAELLKKFDLFVKTYIDFSTKYNKNYKKIEIDGLNGLCLINNNGAKLKIEDLSSGEINIISILYHIIFNTDEGAIVLIDEPEISLHISWQQRLLEYILMLIKGKGIQVIIASHSPFVTSRYENYLTYGININNKTKDFLIQNNYLLEKDLKDVK